MAVVGLRVAGSPVRPGPDGAVHGWFRRRTVAAPTGGTRLRDGTGTGRGRVCVRPPGESDRVVGRATGLYPRILTTIRARSTPFFTQSNARVGR